MLTVHVPERVRNKCERVTGPQPERVRSIFAVGNATRTSGTGPERERNVNRNRCGHGLIDLYIGRTNHILLATGLQRAGLVEGGNLKTVQATRTKTTTKARHTPCDFFRSLFVETTDDDRRNDPLTPQRRLSAGRSHYATPDNS